MKKLFAVLVFVSCNFASATTLVEQFIEAVDMDGTKCVPVERFAFFVVGKLPSNQYELRGDPQMGLRHSVITLKGGALGGKGMLGGFKVKYVKTKHMPTNDGFSYDYVYMENCK